MSSKKTKNLTFGSRWHTITFEGCDMMNYTSEIRKTIEKMKSNELIIAKELYQEKFSMIPEITYYKILERLVEQKVLIKASKGVYYVPDLTRFGLTGPGYEEIVRYFTRDKTGMTVGYDLYNRLKLTTQIGKDYKVLSNSLKAKTKNITGVSIEFIDLAFDEKTKKNIEMLEVLEHYSEIEDFDRWEFKKFLSSFTKEFDEKNLKEVIYKKRYKKRTVAFLSAILNEKGVKNTLNKLLSGTSKYKIPNREELHELTSA
jgi:hypothetical protein